jgi:hypothetical protein
VLEPTTGLDSTAAYSIVQYLVKVAKQTDVAVIMTIHQPSASVFAMLDDLLLLETGRTVYAGTIADAKDYFTSLGFDNPEHINPADYYLELAQHNPKGDVGNDAQSTWNTLFNQHQAKVTFETQMKAVASSSVTKPVAKQPSSLTRFHYLFRYFLSYYLQERGFYVNRLYSLVIIGVFIGTMFLNLKTSTDQITLYAGVVFFSTISCMLTAVASTALFAKNRYEAVDRVSNGVFSPAEYIAAQFAASAIYDFVVTFVYVCLVYWLANLNPKAEVFIYTIVSNWGHSMLMEAALFTTIEILKNDFLSTTFGMIFIGTNIGFAGFFRRITDIPIWIRWMCYMVPLRWSFDGLIWQIFRTQKFNIPGTADSIQGTDILSNVFNLNKIDSWSMWIVLLAYVVFFRLNQWYLFSYQTDTLPKLFGDGANQEVSSKESNIELTKTENSNSNV